MLCWGGGGSTFSSSLPLFHTSTTSKMAEACFCIPILILEFNFKEIFRLHNTHTKKKKKTFEKIPIDYRNEINNGSFAFMFRHVSQDIKRPLQNEGTILPKNRFKNENL